MLPFVVVIFEEVVRLLELNSGQTLIILLKPAQREVAQGMNSMEGDVHVRKTCERREL